MRSTKPPPSPRALTRTICSQAGIFFSRRITSALESAADELEAQARLEEMQDRTGAEAAAVSQEISTIRETASRAAKSFCEGLNADIEQGLLFADAAAGRFTADTAGRQRALSVPGFEVSLLSDDELELSVMVSTVASRFERRTREVFERAVRSVARGYDRDQAEKLRAIIGVFPLINRFSNLLAGVALSVPTRSRLMSGFQFHVLEELGDFYLPLAESLEGVPERRPSVSPSRTEGIRPAGVSGWVQLLNQTGRGGSPGGEAHFSEVAGLSHDELVARLARLPADSPEAGDPAAGQDVNLYEQVVGALQRQYGVSPAQVPAMDLDVLRLVSLFFETFLGDEELPTALRFLVGRLQLPVLRLALADGSFFDEQDHPCRRLIQILCRIGVGWSSELSWVERSPGFKEVSSLIDEILDHPSPTTELFEDAVARLEATHAHRVEKADRVEGRVVELEVGRAKLRAAKLVVQDALNEYLARHRNLASLQWFFADAWSKVLVFACLRHGCDTDEWRVALDICEELAEVMTPAASKAESKQRFAQVPHLLERLESLMVEAGLTSTAVDESIEALYAELDRIRESEDDWFAGSGELVIEQQQDMEPITLIPAPPHCAAEEAGETPEWAHPGAWVRIRDADDPDRYHQVKVAARVTDTSEILLVDERGARWGIWPEQEFASALEAGRVSPVAQDDAVEKTLDAMIAQLTQEPATARISAG